ncbi:MAG: peptidylprolyl isomerase, partial [Clostridia bacterium]
MYTETTEATDFVKIEMASGDSIVVKLDSAVAPLTVENFKKLVGEGFFNGLIFHRVISGFMVQGGDPTGTGMGGSSQTIKGEFAKNGVKNTLSHSRGVI